MNEDQIVNEIVALGRERTPFIRSQISTQNRLRSYLFGQYLTLHAGDDDLAASDPQNQVASSPASLNGQDEDFNIIVNQPGIIPSWLSQPPVRSGLKAPVWRSFVAQTLPHSYVAEKLMILNDLIGVDVRFKTDQIGKAAQKLAVYEWVKAQPGAGPVNLGNIIADAGNLSNYANPAKLWKRMGCAVLEDGTRQRRIAGITQQEAMDIAYNGRRRAVVWNLEQCLIKQNYAGKKPARAPLYYRQLFEDRLQYEISQHPEITEGHAKKRARRYMGKRFLCHLWQAWRGQNAIDDQRLNASAPVMEYDLVT